MEEAVYRFTFDEMVDMSAVEDLLLMAVIAAEGQYGRARVELEAQYDAEPEERICTVNADTDVGQSIARIFSELLSLEIGEDSYQVVRTDLRQQVLSNEQTSGGSL